MVRYSWIYHQTTGLDWRKKIRRVLRKENDSDDFDEQSHRIGPVAYGEIGHGVHYQTGVLFGVSDEAPDAELKAVLEYEF